MNKRLVMLLVLIVIAAAARLIPHPPNFAPVAAIALFGGAYLTDNRLALLLPLSAMLLSDLILGFHGQMIAVYGGFMITVGIGMMLRNRLGLGPVAGAALTSSLVFFLLTNFGVWLFDGMYPVTLEGLVACYVAAIPFFQNSLAGNLFYVAVLFGGFAALERRVPELRLPISGGAPA